MITRVGSISLDVPDLGASIQFFVHKVGLEVTEVDGDTVYLRASNRHHDLILNKSTTGVTALRHLNLEVEGDLAEHVARAVAAGAIDAGPIRHPGVDEAHLLEIPLGYGVKLYSGIEEVPEPSPTAIERPFRFSHFNVTAPDVAAMVEFFGAAFDLRPSDWLGSTDDPFLAWLHCPVFNAPHHGVAILKGDPKLHHIAFDYETVSGLADRVDNYVDESHYLVWGMGRHGTGGSVFAYTEDASGVLVELDSGMISIGDDPRWSEPRVWSLSDQRAVDEWGSAIPEPWLAKRTAFIRPTASANRSVEV
ncbi:VOC family protein [Subtercola sp. YIM 133946]|uniref:VOC family protein n=1 Tax=Subtercola sp. YIM 133946 TaxID=3118909 RepID=UPI002F93C43B